MKVGRAQFTLTPQGTTFHLIGYRDPSRLAPARGVHDDIFGNAILIEQDDRHVFLVSLDVVEIEESMAEEVKSLLADRFGIDRDLVLLSATHDHSSVAEYHRTWWTGSFDQDYLDAMIAQILDAYQECRDGLREATATWGGQEILGYYGNRNHPGEPADNWITVVRFTDLQGAPVATIINWAVHSTALPSSNALLTGDLAGAVATALIPQLGHRPLIINGAAGDSSTRYFREGQDFVELERVSEALARRIAGIPTDRGIDSGPVRCQTLFHTVHDGDFHLDAKAWVIDIAGLRLFVFPGELGSAFGPQLRDAQPAPALVCGYTNGYYAYWLPAAEYGLSFETRTSRIPRGEPERLVAKLMQVATLFDA